jgi:predicted thioredoxin/glutaredoxin
MTDYQNAATEASQFLAWLDRARKGAEALTHCATIEATAAEKIALLNRTLDSINQAEQREADLRARIDVLKETHDDLLARTREQQARFASAKEAIARVMKETQ